MLTRMLGPSPLLSGNIHSRWAAGRRLCGTAWMQLRTRRFSVSG
jgi:hypothetical protein